METFSALLDICAGNSPVSGERPVTQSFDISFDLLLNKRLSKQSWGWWFETLSCPLLRQRHGSTGCSAPSWSSLPYNQHGVSHSKLICLNQCQGNYFCNKWQHRRWLMDKTTLSYALALTTTTKLLPVFYYWNFLVFGNVKWLLESWHLKSLFFNLVNSF